VGHEDFYCESVANSCILPNVSQINYEIETVLRQNGVSVTKQRLLVFNLLRGREPLTIYELYDLANGQLDRASLYRTISVFEKLNVVKRVNIGWKYKIELSDNFAEHHHHLTCLKCDGVTAINEDELEAFIATLSSKYGFAPVEHQVEVQGYCKNCSVVNAPINLF
jgi:Fur family ferric uptake transcriptional regulator